jgi:CDP-2,3-bis-(O-geranylgeranyl)-sn-glycerol synthase
MLTIKILLLLFAANGAPIILRKLLDKRYDGPVDFGLVWRDGQPLLGPSKTWRGIAGALLAGAAASFVLGLGIRTGLAVGALAMAGDLFSSFLKRRLGVPPSGMALGLDQIPEALFPLLWLDAELHLGRFNVVWLSAVFLVLELAISRVLYWLNIRKQPY